MIPPRRILRACIPVGLIELYRRHVPRKPIWDGIYTSADQVPASGEGFNSATWARDARAAILPLLRSHENQEPLPTDAAHLTFLTVALFLARLQASLRVLSFGGALDPAYIFLINSLRDTAVIDYRVVELPRVCEEGHRVFEDDSRIRFAEEFPPGSFTPDIVYTRGAIQFSRNYKQTIEKLAGYSAPFMLFADLPAGDNPTFASAQTNISGQVPAWFFNFKEFVEMLRTLPGNYVVAIDSQFETGNDMSNFPRTHRIKNYHTILFCRADWLEQVRRATQR